MTPADRLFALDAAFDEDITEAGAEFQRLLIRVLADLRARAEQLIQRLARQDGRIVTNEVNLGLVAAAEDQLRDTLIASGYQDVVESSLGKLSDLVDLGLRGFTIGNLAQSFTGFDVQTLVAFRQLKLGELGDIGDQAARELSGQLLRGVLGAQDERELVKELAEVLEETAAHARTLYETALGEFMQTLTGLGSEGTPEEPFLYTGPVDLRIRPFCFERVGQVFSRAEIDQMDNGQLGNTFLTRGGYNCRHQWRRVSALSELREQADSGEVVSEAVARQLAQVEEARAAGKRIRYPKRRAA